METGQDYVGGGIEINGNVISIGSSVPMGTVIKVYIHNTYQEFTNTYNIYVGGNTVIKFKSGLNGSGESAYNSSVTYDVASTNGNMIYLKDLFSITNLAGDAISMKVGGDVTISLTGNANGSYTFARLVNVANGSGESVPTYIAIDNYANQGGQIVKISIEVSDASGTITSAVYRLKVAPSVVAFTNPNGTVNSQSNPFEVYGVASSTENLLYKASGSDATDLINFSALVANANSSITYGITDLSLRTTDSALSVYSTSSKLYFTVNSTVLSERIVVIYVETKWGRSVPYYVKLLPKDVVTVESSNANVVSAYALTDYGLFNNSNDTYVQIMTYDVASNQYLIQNYNSSTVVVEVYENGELLNLNANDSLVNLSSTGILSFGAVRTNTVLDVKVYLSSERGVANKQTLQELKVVLMPNFNSADIVINVNGEENSINNPIHLTDDGFYLTDLLQINRYVDSSISTERFPNGLEDYIHTFNFESEVLNINTNYKVLVQDSYTSSSDKIANIDLYLNDDVVFKTFYVQVDANYAFVPIK
ncbi:MAG: hypothetical protein ACI4TX_03950, partial [Christensenellales bacterium]